MAEGKITTKNIQVVEQKIFGNNAVHVIESIDLPTISEYHPIGVIGYYPGGGWLPADALSQIFVKDNKLYTAWSQAIPTTTFLSCMILYVSD